MKTILWAILLLIGLGLVFGTLIVLFSHIFHVQEDPRIKEVEKLLPGVNCGACGKAGCHDLAEAIVKEGVAPTACKAGKKEKNFDPIVAYLANAPKPEE